MTAVCFILFIAGVLATIATGIPLAYALGFGMLLFSFMALRLGVTLKELIPLLLKGMKTALPTVIIFILVGMMTAAWRSSGTFAYMVYEGMRFMRPDLFILCAFLAVGVVSFLIGSSFGACSTLGVILFIMARAGNVPDVFAAGAIISGAMLGDRGSPVSGSCNLTAGMTNTKVEKNVVAMLKTAAVPFAAACVIYFLLSRQYPLENAGSWIASDIEANYRISLLLIAPAAVVLILPLCRVNIRITMAASLVISALIAVFCQNVPPLELLRSLFYGYRPTFTGAFADRIAGGGLRTMISTVFVILFGSTYSRIFDRTKVLSLLEGRIITLGRKTNAFTATLVTGIAAACIAASQTLSIILTSQLMKNVWDALDCTPEERAIYMENSLVPLSGIIPWNACCTPLLSVLSVSAGVLPFAFYVYFIPLWNLFTEALHTRRKTPDPA